ncbi:MAG: hypothetical protein NVV83_00110 [Afipia sp.]|nr:hypothetical protein [Afipia sp.]
MIGRESFAQISAVEGIEITAEMQARFKEFERLGLTSAQRRREILKLYSKSQDSKK